MSKKINRKVTVEFICDAILDHKAKYEDCCKTSKREFKSLEEAEPFISECTQVINLSEIYGTVSLDKVKGLNKELFNTFN